MSEQEYLMLSPEEIEKMSKILAETLTQQPEIVEAISIIKFEELTVICTDELLESLFAIRLEKITIIHEDEITHVINLDLIASCTFGLTDPLGQFQEWLTNMINSIASWIVSGVQTFINRYVLPAFDSLYGSIKSFINKYVLPAFDSLYDSVYSGITGFINNYVLPAFDSLYSSISDFINTTVLPAIDSVASTIGSFIESAVSSIGSFIESAVSSISSKITNVYNSIVSAIDDVIDTLSSVFSSLIEGVYNVVTNIASTLTVIGDSILSAISFINLFIGSMTNMIINGIMGIGASITGLFDFLVSSFTNISSMVATGFQAISTTFMGFVNAILQLPYLLSQTFQPIGEWIWSAVPDWLKTPIENIGKFFTEDLVNAVTMFSAGLQEFMSDPAGWFKVNIVEPAFGFLSFLGEKASSLITFIIDMLKGVWKAVENAFSGFMKFIGSALSDFLKGTYESLGEIGEGFRPIFESAYKPIPKSTGEKISEIFKPFFEDIFEELKIGTPVYLAIDYVAKQIFNQFSIATTILLSPFWAQIPIRLASFILYNVGQFIHGLEIPIRINLTPFGIGVDKTFNLAKAIGASLSHFSAEIRKWVDEVGRGIVYGFAIWATRPITKSLNFLVRNIVPVELPQLNVIREFTRRALAHENYNEIVKLAWYYMALYGYSDYVVDLFFKSAEEYHIEIKDRFGTTRKIPLALVYNLPSASDVARMAIRDIFGAGGTAIDNFLKIYQATGMYKDVGILYYMLHYRYPPPERLWNFTTRGISGLLWADISPALKEKIKQEAKKLGAVMPTPAYTWNFKAKELFTAFQLYMTWHDYARFSWIKKEMLKADEHFTSDNLIYIDTLADIPTKIDQRWMVKWGLYELLSKKGVSYKSPIQDFVKKIVEDNPASKIQMDLTNFSRTLQATGMHPYWIPVTAVAEAMNALTEERTYMRTGAINLFKEGFISDETLSEIFSGAFTVSFKVSYFDLTDYKWKKGYINLPVMYLPAERKLLELRAFMDRALDILREIQRDISQAYQEAIIPDYETYKERLTKVIESIKNLVPEKIKIEYVEELYKPYVEALGIYREVYTVRRIRSWTMRWLGWIMYRVATGLVTEKELSQLVSTLAKYSRLTNTELTFFSDVLKVMRGIAVKEYIPTPTQIATISEYVAVPEELIKQCFEIRMIPEKWRPIWAKYIKIKPFVDDIKSLLTTYRRALLYIEIPEEVKKQVEKLAKFIGFSQMEMDILKLRVSLEELIRDSREYIPTPYSLATLCEYVPKAREFFDEVMKAKRVPERWQKIWAEYIDIRPLVNDVRTYLNRAEKLYVRFMITKENFQKILDEVSKFLGYTAKEIEFLMKVTELERARNAWTELIGTVERLVSLSEYSPTASKYALGKLNAMIDSLPIPNDEKQELKKMWEEYIRNRPVKSEARMYITQLINLYIDGLITDSDFKRELQAMKKWGFSDNEIMFYEAIAALRKARKLRIPIGYPEEEQAG